MPPNNVERSIGRLEGKIDGMVMDIQNVNQSMTNLKSSFDVLEQGRLSGLEVRFATLQAEVSLKAKNTAMWASSIVAGAISIISGAVLFFIAKLP